MPADTSARRKHEAPVAAAAAASAKSMSEGGDGDVRGDSVRHLCRRSFFSAGMVWWWWWLTLGESVSGNVGKLFAR